MIDLVVELFGSNYGEAEYQVIKTKESHACFSWMRQDFKKRLEEAS